MGVTPITLHGEGGSVTAPPAAFEAALGELRTAGKPPMKETSEDRQVRDAAYAVAADELRQFVEQFEQLEAEKREITDQQKDVMAEAKARGYDTKALRKLIALRKRDKDDLAEEEAILEIYKAALGMV